MDVKNKAKDNQKVRMDVAKLCVRGDLKLVQLQNGKLARLKTTTLSQRNMLSQFKNGSLS